jgi:hypothetical protein
MKLRQLTSSLLTATALLTSTLPAFAGPFDAVKPVGGIFQPSAVVKPGAGVGNVTPGTSTPAPSNPNGNSEIQGLGDHQSWVDQGTLAKDPRALCSDVGLGNNTSSSSTKLALVTSSDVRSSSAKTHNDGGGGGGSFLGIVSVNGGGSSQGSQNNTDSKVNSSNRNDEKTNSSSTVVQGKNCDAFVNSAAARDMNYEDNLTRRYDIKTGRRGQQVNQLLDKK